MKLNEAFKIYDNFFKVNHNDPHAKKRSNIDEITEKYSCNKNLSINWNKIEFNRIDFIKLALLNFDNPSYLEIGTHHNDCFDQIDIEDKIGVDPAGKGEKVIKKTSDDFFSDLNKESKFKVIFIDGLHTYEQVRKDTYNSLRHLDKDGYIFFHDMIPLDWRAECPERIQVTWNGDVWKIGVELSAIDKFKFHVAIADHGIGVLQKKIDNDFQNDKDFSYIKDFKYKDFFTSNIDYMYAKDSIELLKKN